MIRNSLYLRYVLGYFVAIVVLSAVTIWFAKYLVPHRIYLFWLYAGGPTMVFAAAHSARLALSKHNPEWGVRVAQFFTLSLFTYFLVAVALPIVEAQLPNTVTAVFRREKQSDIDLAGTVDAPMLEAQQALMEYGNRYRDAEVEQLRKGFEELAAKRKNGAFGSEDEAKEQQLLSRYTALSKKLADLQAIAKGQAQPVPQSAAVSPTTEPAMTAEPSPPSKPIEVNPYIRLVHVTAESGGQIATAISPESENWVGLDMLKSELRRVDPRVQPDAFDSVQMNANGLFDKIYGGQLSPLERSGALSHFQYVVLMRVHKHCNPITVSGVQMVSCNLRMEAKAFDRSGRTVVNASVQATGPGFSEDEALDVAVKRIAGEAKMSILAPLHN
jgi:hypothetical protein